MLRSARVVTASEGSGKRGNVSRLKQVTGGDAVQGRFMRKDFFEYEPKFALFMASNVVPEFGDEDALWSRLQVIPFNGTSFRGADNEVASLGKRIADTEAEGVLALAVREAGAWFREGLLESGAVDARTGAEQGEQNPLAQFFDEFLVQSHDPSDRLRGQEIYLAYQGWCIATKEEPVFTSSRTMIPALKQHMGDPAESLKRNGQRVPKRPVEWRGWRLNRSAPEVVRDNRTA